MRLNRGSLIDDSKAHAGPLSLAAVYAVQAHEERQVERLGLVLGFGQLIPVHMTKTSAGKDRGIAPPHGHGGFISGGAFSPDGRLFAGFVSAPSDSSPAAQLVVVDLGPSIAVVIDDGVATKPTLRQRRWTALPAGPEKNPSLTGSTA